MTIGIDASRANRERKTGVEWYSYYLIQELKKIGSSGDINFILYSPDKLKGDLEKLPNNWQTRILRWPFKYLWTQIRLSWEMIFHPPDVLFIPAHALPIFCRSRTLITLHDLGFERLPKVYSFWQRVYLRFVYQWAANHADKIIVPSEFTKKELIELYKTDSEKIKVVYLGYDDKIYRPIQNQEEIERVLVKYKIQQPYLLYVGRLEKKKNIKNLIIAYKLLITHYRFSPSLAKSSNIPKLILVGRKDIKFNLPFGSIIQIDYLSPQELACFYAGAECFVFPSLYEGFGLPILEAMACGCPVVASRAGAIPEISGSAVKYFNPRNVEEITKSILKVIKDRETREIMIQDGLEQVKKYSWAKCAKETMEIIRNIKS